jgi:hypothetical protein
MIEPVSGTRCLRRHMTAVVGIDRRLERHPAGNFNAGLCETVELGRIVGEQRSACGTAQGARHRGPHHPRIERCGLETTAPRCRAAML